MKGETIQCIFYPTRKDDWVVLKTNGGSYTLRLGGYRKETDFIQIFEFDEIPFPFKGRTVKEVYSDDFWVYIVLDNGGVVSSGEVDISTSGETRLGVQFERITDFDNGFFDSDSLFKLVTDETGWSVKH